MRLIIEIPDDFEDYITQARIVENPDNEVPLDFDGLNEFIRRVFQEYIKDCLGMYSHTYGHDFQLWLERNEQEGRFYDIAYEIKIEQK